jgi:hypothetical protein
LREASRDQGEEGKDEPEENPIAVRMQGKHSSKS